MTKRLMKKSQKSQNKQNITKKEKNKTSWLPVLHQLPLSPWCQRKISLTLVPFITSTQTSCKLPGTFPLTYSIWNPFLCFCALSRTKHTLSTKPMKSIRNFTRKFYMLLKPIPLHPRKEHPPVMQQKLPLVAQLDFKSGTHTHTLTVLRNMLVLHLDLQALLIGLRWTRRSPIWLVQVLALS